MKKHHRLFLCLLVAVLIAFGMVACGGSEQPAPAQQTASGSEPVRAEEPAKVEPVAEAIPEPTPEPTEEPTATPTPEPTPTPAPESLIEETVVVNNIAGVTVTAKKLKETDTGYELTLEAHNDSDGYTLNLVPTLIRVNGFDMSLADAHGDNEILCLCNAHTHATDKFLIPHEELALLGIESIDSLTVAFEVRMHNSSSDRVDEFAEAVDLIKGGEQYPASTPGTVFYSDGTLLLSALGLNEQKNGVYLYYETSGTEGLVTFIHQCDDDFNGFVTVNGQKNICNPYLMESNVSIPSRGVFVVYVSGTQPAEPIATLSFELEALFYHIKRPNTKIPAVEMSFDENGIAVLDPAYIVEVSAAASSDNAPAASAPKDGPITVTASEPFENDKLKISVTGVEAYDGDLAVTMKAENKSDEALELSENICLANGYQVSMMMSRKDFTSAPLDPGAEAEYRIHLYDLDFYNMSADSVSEISLSVRYGAPGGWFSDMSETDPATATLDQKPAEPLDLSGYSVLYDANDVKIVCLGRSKAGTGLLVYVENNTDQELSMTADGKMKIDGYATSDWPVYIAPGIKRIVEYNVYEQNGSLLSIDWQIKEATVGFRLQVRGRNDTTAIVTEPLGD